MELLGFVAVGLAAGFLASRLLQRGRLTPFGYLVLGVLGSLVGGFVLGLVGYRETTLLARLVTATLGAIGLVLGAERLSKRRRR